MKLYKTFLHLNEIRLENYSLFESFSKSIFASLFFSVLALFIEIEFDYLL